ncbi:MAG: hypothetical protein ACREK1_04030 [Longimicrobiales bacterium]
MKICVLGPLELRPGTGAPIVATGTRQRLLLAALVLHAPRVVSADRLIDILWHDNLPARCWVTRLLRSQLADVTNTDPLTYAAAFIVIASTALLAAALPGLRASRIDPQTALRSV